jgi:hypothetical protein
MIPISGWLSQVYITSGGYEPASYLETLPAQIIIGIGCVDYVTIRMWNGTILTQYNWSIGSILVKKTTYLYRKRNES